MIIKEDILKVKGNLISSGKNLSLKYNAVSINSAEVKRGNIFFAIKGENTDAHKYIDEVIKRKAGLVFVNRKWYRANKDKYKNIVFYVVEDTIKALGELANVYKKRMNIPLLGIAGSNGKTSTKDIISEVLSKKFNVLKTKGNLNNHIGLPLTLLSIRDEHNFCIAELGSNHFGELEYLCKISEPDFGLVTNIGKEHLEYFKTIKGVAKEEFTLYDYVRENGSCCFYNLDDEYINAYYKKFRKESYTYSYRYKSDVKGYNDGYDKNYKPRIIFEYNNKKHRATVNTFGKHSIYNGLAAISAGLYFGISPKNICEALSKLNCISQKRMEVQDYSGIKVINDTYNSNPNSVKLGLETLLEYKTKGKKHIVISDMLEMGSNADKEHFEIGKCISRMKFDSLYSYGKHSFNIFKGAKNLKNNFYFEAKEDLSGFLKLNIRKGDIIYFKGSRGMKVEEIIQNVFTNQKNEH